MSNLLDTVKAVLSTMTIRWLNLTGRLPQDLLACNPLPNEWSAMDCLCHKDHDVSL